MFGPVQGQLAGFRRLRSVKRNVWKKRYTFPDVRCFFGGLEPGGGDWLTNHRDMVVRPTHRVYFVGQTKRNGGACSPGEAAVMEKIPVACAMEWSIELEKALRSKVTGKLRNSSKDPEFLCFSWSSAPVFSAETAYCPGRAVEAILEVGRRLERWNLEPEPTMSAYNLYGLVPGEERLFANSIVLRLADAFVTGNRDIKLAVMRAFLGLSSCERKRRRRKRGSKIKDGILSKGRVNNFPELLRRVKTVFDSGDAESRAMALVLFGCWADFAKDSAHVRYLLLSNMVSSDVSVVSPRLPSLPAILLLSRSC